MIKTIEILGSEKFEEICNLYRLTEEEKLIIKKILEQWDETIKQIPDFEKRMEKKLKIFSENLKDREESEILKITNVMIKIMQEFIKKVAYLEKIRKKGKN